jgi:hypothetical protein
MPSSPRRLVSLKGGHRGGDALHEERVRNQPNSGVSVSTEHAVGPLRPTPRQLPILFTGHRRENPETVQKIRDLIYRDPPLTSAPLAWLLNVDVLGTTCSHTSPVFRAGAASNRASAAGDT